MGERARSLRILMLDRVHLNALHSSKDEVHLKSIHNSSKDQEVEAFPNSSRFLEVEALPHSSRVQVVEALPHNREHTKDVEDMKVDAVAREVVWLLSSILVNLFISSKAGVPNSSNHVDHCPNTVAVA